MRRLAMVAEMPSSFTSIKQLFRSASKITLVGAAATLPLAISGCMNPEERLIHDLSRGAVTANLDPAPTSEARNAMVANDGRCKFIGVPDTSTPARTRLTENEVMIARVPEGVRMIETGRQQNGIVCLHETLSERDNTLGYYEHANVRIVLHQRDAVVLESGATLTPLRVQELRTQVHEYTHLFTYRIRGRASMAERSDFRYGSFSLAPVDQLANQYWDELVADQYAHSWLIAFDRAAGQRGTYVGYGAKPSYRVAMANPDVSPSFAGRFAYGFFSEQGDVDNWFGRYEADLSLPRPGLPVAPENVARAWRVHTAITDSESAPAQNTAFAPWTSTAYILQNYPLAGRLELSARFVTSATHAPHNRPLLSHELAFYAPAYEALIRDFRCTATEATTRNYLVKCESGVFYQDPSAEGAQHPAVTLPYGHPIVQRLLTAQAG